MPCFFGFSNLRYAISHKFPIVLKTVTIIIFWLIPSAPFLLMKDSLLSILGNFNCSLLENNSKVLTQTLFFRNMSLSASNNSKILSATTDFILSTKRFDKQIF